MEPELLKVMVIGASNSGRRCLVRRFINGDFIEDYDPFHLDPGRKALTIDDKKYLLEIEETYLLSVDENDVGVQRRYSAPMDGYLCLFSITSRSSFVELKRLISLLEQTRGRGLPMVIVGTKCELPLTDRLIESQDVQEVKEFARSLHAPYFEVSARHNINCLEPFQGIVKLITKEREMKDQVEQRGDSEGSSNKKCVIC